VPARRAAELRNQEIQRQCKTLNAAGNRLQYRSRAAPKPFGAHSNRELDCFYKHDPVTNYWIFKPTGRIVDPSIHLEIERELARKKDLNYLGFEDTVIYCNNGEWEFVTVRDFQARTVEGRRDKRRPTGEAAPSSLSMHGKSHACSEVRHDEHHHVVRKPSGMRSACHEEGNEQLAVERAGRERTAHEEPSSRTKTKKSMMQRANSAASLVGSVRDTAKEQEGDDVVKPMQRKVRAKPPDDGSKRSTSSNDVVHRNDARKGEALVNGRGTEKQGRPPDDGLHATQRSIARGHLEAGGVGMVIVLSIYYLTFS
jgi:hypothetical protein